MTTDSDSLSRIRRGIRQSASADEILTQLGELDDLVQVGDLPRVDAYELRRDAFRTVQELTVDDPFQARAFMLDHVLPYCLRSVAGLSEDVRRAISDFRSVLTDWIEQYPEAERTALREAMLDRVLEPLTSDHPKGAIWTVAMIGFRRQDIVDALWRIAESSEDETGDAALSALTSLGPSGDLRTRLVSALHQRAALRCNRALVGAVLRLADPDSVDVVKRTWLGAEGVQSDPVLTALVVRALTYVADMADDDGELQDRVWGALIERYDRDPSQAPFGLYTSSDVAPRCNSEKVVPYLLSRLAQHPDGSDAAGYRRWLLCMRMEQCVRPAQLRGWFDKLEATAIPVLRKDAIQDTGHTGTWVSAERRQKESAWKTLLAMGYAEALGWYEEAVATESEPSARWTISDMLACFRVDPLPPTAVAWVKERYDVPAGDTSREILSRLAAVELAQSAASREAFDALLSFGLSVEGNVLQTSADALAVVAGELTGAGEAGVVEMLVEVVENSTESRHRLAAAGALISLAIAGHLPGGLGWRLSTCLSGDERDVIEMGEIVAVLGWLTDYQLPPDVLGQLRTWARTRDDWLGHRSLETLARTGYLASEPDLLSGPVGLIRTDHAWDWAPGRTAVENASFVIGLLYSQDQEQFTQAVASLLKQAQWHVALPAARILCDVHGMDGRRPTPPMAVQALIERIGGVQTTSYAETQAFDVLSQVAPDALAAHPWPSVWNDMLPEARAALSDALGRAAFRDRHSASKAISHLILLSRDGQYAVRRAAYRGLAQRDPDTLVASCGGWSRASSVELRRRAAEACAWLPDDTNYAAAFEALHGQLVADAERIVRQAAVDSRVDRRERLWAKEYLSRILAGPPETNVAILALWAYGQALVQLGDDDCLRMLRAELGRHRHAPHVQHWYERMVKGMAERGQKVTQKWPEPWFAWEGAMETGEGTLGVTESRTLAVHYSLWHQPPEVPGQPGAWGGAVWPADVWDALQDRLALTLDDGRCGKARLGGLSGEILTLVGDGPYPA